MSTPIKVVAVSGSLNDPSKTTVLLQEILDRLALVHPIEARLIKLTEIGPHFAGALSRAELPAVVEDELQAIETADLLVVASPVYRASFTGLFKHLFDFVDQYALVDTPVLLAASGGSERHALIIEHQFRPLFAFFQALTLPLGIYAHDSARHWGRRARSGHRGHRADRAFRHRHRHPAAGRYGCAGCAIRLR